jgi:hypothetical protein
MAGGERCGSTPAAARLPLGRRFSCCKISSHACFSTSRHGEPVNRPAPSDPAPQPYPARTRRLQALDLPLRASNRNPRPLARPAKWAAGSGGVRGGGGAGAGEEKKAWLQRASERAVACEAQGDARGTAGGVIARRKGQGSWMAGRRRDDKTGRLKK